MAKQEIIDLIAEIDIAVTGIEGNEFYKEPIYKKLEKLREELGISYAEFSKARAEMM